MPNYLVGNFLRGHYAFEAETDEEAWEKGKVIFDAHYPSKHGRAVYLLKLVQNGETNGTNPEGTKVPKHHQPLGF